jgi:excisionase family DNA binding protein
MLAEDKNLQDIRVISGRGPIYTVEEVSDLLGIPRPTLYRYLREYSIPHLRRSGRISIPEESFERIREARDLHKEGLGTGSVRRLLREGGGQHAGELKEQLDQLSENVERLRGNERSPADEALPSHALRTILARQNLLISAMFNLTEMVEDLLLASGKPRKAVFEDVEGEIRGVAPPRERSHPETLEAESSARKPILETLPAQRATRFGSLARRRRRGIVALSALMTVVLLAWALPAVGSELSLGLPFFGGREAESPPRTPVDAAEGEGATQDRPAGNEGSGASGSGEAERVEVPDVSDRGPVEAARVISRAGLEVGAVKTVKSQREAGTVMRTKPTAGTAVKPETPVVLVASGGPTGIPPGTWGADARGAVSNQYAN